MVMLEERAEDLQSHLETFEYLYKVHRILLWIKVLDRQTKVTD